jgi:hypothetical protein
MFKGCERLETIYVGDGFDVIRVGQSGDMFKNCKNINGAITYQDSSTDKYEANMPLFPPQLFVVLDSLFSSYFIF